MFSCFPFVLLTNINVCTSTWLCSYVSDKLQFVGPENTGYIVMDPTVHPLRLFLTTNYEEQEIVPTCSQCTNYRERDDRNIHASAIYILLQITLHKTFFRLSCAGEFCIVY